MKCVLLESTLVRKEECNERLLLLVPSCFIDHFDCTKIACFVLPFDNFSSSFRTIGFHELQAEEYWWLQHRQYFTWLHGRSCKLRADGCTVYRSKYVISPQLNSTCHLAPKTYYFCANINFLAFYRFLGELLRKHREDSAIFGMECYQILTLISHFLIRLRYVLYGSLIPAFTLFS